MCADTYSVTSASTKQLAFAMNLPTCMATNVLDAPPVALRSTRSCQNRSGCASDSSYCSTKVIGESFNASSRNCRYCRHSSALILRSS
jgi:hypothetical protein